MQMVLIERDIRSISQLNLSCNWIVFICHIIMQKCGNGRDRGIVIWYQSDVAIITPKYQSKVYDIL